MSRTGACRMDSPARSERIHRGQDAGSVQQQDPAERVHRRRRFVHRRHDGSADRGARDAVARAERDRPVLAVGAFTRDGKLAVDYYDRQYGNDETTGSSDFSLSGSDDLTNFGQVRVTSSSMPAPTQFEGPAGGQFYGDYVWLSAATRPTRSGRTPARRTCSCVRAAGHPALRRSCAARRRPTARSRTTRRRSWRP